jgi:putative spermidine/putrescine transport system substrate-binding protein
VTSFRCHALGLALLPLMLAVAPAHAQTPQAGTDAPAETPAAAPEMPAAPAPNAEAAPPAEAPPAPSVAEPAAPATPPASPSMAQPADPVPATPPASPSVAQPADPAPATPPASPSVAQPAEPAPATPPASPSVAQPAEPNPATPPAPAPAIAQPTAPAAPPLDPKDVKLKIASQGGAYIKSQEFAYFQPFARRSGYGVSGIVFDGSLAALQAQAGSPAWDVVDLDQGVLIQACEQGLLEPLDAALVQPGPDGTPPSEDFLPGAIQPCGVANVAWSAAVVYDKGLKTQPTKVENFFDLKRYPGKRTLPRTPQHTLELALLADGVAPAQVYALLATKEGQDRAFAKLSAIKDQIVWWDRPREGLEKIAKKQAAMGIAFNGRAFMAMIKARQPVALLWDHQIYHLSYWAIPKGSKFAGPAREFIGFATGAGPMSDQTRWLPYGPARASAVRLVGKHAELNLDMKPFLPTHQPNLQGALAFDAVWWTAQEPALKDRFTAWLEGREPAGGEPATSQ